MITTGHSPDELPEAGRLGHAAWLDLPAAIHAIGADEHDAGDSGSSVTVTWSIARHQTLRLTADCTINFAWTGCEAGAYVLRLRQDSTGGRTATEGTGTPGADGWANNDAAGNTAANGLTIIILDHDGAGVCRGTVYRINSA